VPIITKLEVQKHDQSRVNLFVDEKFFCGITLDDIVRLKIHKNDEVSELALTEIKSVAEKQDFYNKALNYVLTSPKPEKKVRDYLFKKKVSREVIDEIIEKIKNLGYINDEEYAKSYIDAKREKLGRGQIRQKLRFNGIAGEIVDRNVAEIESQTELAEQVAEKYVRNKPRDFKLRNKLFAHLLAKGFDFDLAGETTNKILKEEI
jgi:regulatory protein